MSTHTLEVGGLRHLCSQLSILIDLQQDLDRMAYSHMSEVKSQSCQEV